MSFLFTFSLPQLSIPNPFSTGDSSEQRSTQVQRRSEGLGERRRRPRSGYEEQGGYDGYYSRDAYGAHESVRQAQRREPHLSMGEEGGDERERTMSRKRKNMRQSFGEYGYEDANVVREDDATRPFRFSRGGYQIGEILFPHSIDFVQCRA